MKDEREVFDELIKYNSRLLDYKNEIWEMFDISKENIKRIMKLWKQGLFVNVSVTFQWVQSLKKRGESISFMILKINVGA